MIGRPRAAVRAGLSFKDADRLAIERLCIELHRTGPDRTFLLPKDADHGAATQESPSIFRKSSVPSPRAQRRNPADVPTVSMVKFHGASRRAC